MERTLNAPLPTDIETTQQSAPLFADIPELQVGMLAQPAKPVISAPLFENAPLVLRPLKQWICWRYEWRRGKWDKVPYMALGLSKDGRPYGASTAKPKHWRTLDDARRAYEASQSWREPFNG